MKKLKILLYLFIAFMFVSCTKNYNATITKNTNFKKNISEISDSVINNYIIPEHDFYVEFKNTYLYSKMYGKVGSFERDWRYINLEKDLDFFGHGEIKGIFSMSPKEDAFFSNDAILEKLDANTAILKSIGLDSEILFKNVKTIEQTISFDLIVNGKFLCKAEIGGTSVQFPDNIIDILPINISQELLNQSKFPWFAALAALAASIDAGINIYDQIKGNKQKPCDDEGFREHMPQMIAACTKNGNCFTIDWSMCIFRCHLCK